jgi:hypothetical protein
MGPFIHTVNEHNGVATTQQQEQAHPKIATPPPAVDNRPLNALPAVKLPGNMDEVLDALEEPLLPPKEATAEREDGGVLLINANEAAAALAAQFSPPPSDVEPLPLRDQSPLHLQAEETKRDAEDPFADIYQDFKERELSPEPAGYRYVPLKGNDTASPVRLGGYGTEPSPLTARGITRPVHERGNLDPVDSATKYELLPPQDPAPSNQPLEALFDTKDANQSSRARGEGLASALALIDHSPLGLKTAAPRGGAAAKKTTASRKYLRRGMGHMASESAAKQLARRAAAASRGGRNYDPFATVDAALAELGHEERPNVRHPTALPAAQPKHAARHWGYQAALVQQPDIDQAPNFKKNFSKIHAKVDRRQRCFNVAAANAAKIEMPDFTTNFDEAPRPTTQAPLPQRRLRAGTGALSAVESDAFRGIDELLLNKKPPRHWGYEAAIVRQPEIDQAPHFKKTFARREQAGRTFGIKGAHRGGMAWFIPMSGGALRTKGGLAWVVDWDETPSSSSAPASGALMPANTAGTAVTLPSGFASNETIPMSATLDRSTLPAAPVLATAVEDDDDDENQNHNGNDDGDDRQYWKRTDSTVTSSSHHTDTAGGESSGSKPKKGSKLKKLASKLIHSFGKHKTHHDDTFAGRGAPRAVRTSAYPLGLPVAPVLEKQRIKEMRRQGVAVPAPKDGDVRTDAAFVGPVNVNCPQVPTTPLPHTSSTAIDHNGPKMTSEAFGGADNTQVHSG